ncbi:MAG: hypothetical protein C5B55_00250 [Blastocatellia bacterium]|nr:MAG: hypothetical protein C5B55_00250 [Blastocatellia bacterium]
MTAPQISIVIVNWNTGDLLQRCVESVAKSRLSLPFEIIVVDNASYDDSVASLRESAASLLSNQQLRIIQNSDNIGFGRANNQAFALTRSPFVFLLNPDAAVEPDAIQTLLETLQSDGRIAASGPKIVNPDGSTQVSVYFAPPTFWHTFMWQLKLYTILPRRIRGELLLGPHWAHDRKRDVPMFIGAALLVRREVIDQVGGFDEQFEMYAEDHEWCWRMRQAGWRLVFNPSATVMHHGGISSAKRWSHDEKVRVRLNAGFRFEQLALSRSMLIANQIANCAVVSLQINYRRILGRDISPLKLVREVYRQNLQRSLKWKNRGEPASDPARRGASA